MDIGDIDPEDFQREWRQARRAWDQVNQRKLEMEVAGLPSGKVDQAGPRSRAGR